MTASLVVQPNFTKSDVMFTGLETIQSTSVETHLSGNKQAVNLSKTVGYLKQDLQKGNSCRLNKVWLTWIS